MSELRGFHVVCDGVAPRQRADQWDDGLVSRWLEHVVDLSGLHIIKGPVVEQSVDGNLLVGFAVIAESHLAVHLKRKERACWAEMFSCQEFDVGEFIAVTSRFFGIGESGSARWFPRSAVP